MKIFKIFPFLLALCLLFGLMAPAALALDEPALEAEAVILLNMENGEALFSRSAEERRSPASLTKIMTALLAVEAIERGEVSLDDAVSAGLDCQQGLNSDSSNVSIVSGEVMTLQDLLNCAMVASANEACNVIASYLAGSISAFVEKMNERAAQLGCLNTHFADPNGLSSMDDGHYSTASDLARLSLEAMKHELFVELVNTVTYTVPATNANAERVLNNSNALISAGSIYGSGYVYEGASGIKTGYTRPAGYCLISTAERNGIRLLAVVLGCLGPYNSDSTEVGNFVATRALYDWAFANYSYRTVLSAEEAVQSVSIALSNDALAILRPSQDVTLLLPNDVDPSTRQLHVKLYDEQPTAPIRAGQPLGDVTIEIGGKLYGPITLASNLDIEVAKSEHMREEIGAFFQRGWVRAVIIVLCILLILYFILVARYRSLRKKHLREQRLREQRRREARKKREAEIAASAKAATQRFTAIDPAERDIDLKDLERFFDEARKE